MREFNELADQCKRAAGIEHDLYAETRTKKNFEWDGSTLKSIRTDHDGGVGLRTLGDERSGFAYTNLAAVDADWLLDQARANRELLPADSNQELTDAAPSRDVQTEWYDTTVRDDIVDRKKQVETVVSETLEQEDVLRNLQVEYQEIDTRFELYRDGEFRAGERRTRFSVSAWAICEGDSDVQSGFQQQTSYRHEDLNVRDVLSDAVRNGRRKLGASPPESETTTVLLTPRSASSLLRLVKDMLDGEAVAKGRSAWDLDTIGTSVGNKRVTVRDDPAREAGSSNSVYDAEGHRMEPVTLIDDGECTNILTNQYVSNQLEIDNNHRAARGYSSTPRVGSTNFYLEPGDGSAGDLREELGSGPVVTGIQPGSGLDAVGGQFSVGASGFYLENGEQADAFDEATISGEVESFLNNVIRVGSDIPLGYSVACPSLLVNDLSLGGSE